MSRDIFMFTADIILKQINSVNEITNVASNLMEKYSIIKENLIKRLQIDKVKLKNIQDSVIKISKLKVSTFGFKLNPK